MYDAKIERLRAEKNKVGASISELHTALMKQNLQVDQAKSQQRYVEGELAEMEERMKLKLLQSQQKATRAQETLHSMQKGIDKAQTNERELTVELGEFKQRINARQVILDEANAQKEELKNEFQYYNEQLKGRVPIDQTLKLCCRECKSRLRQLYRQSQQSFVSEQSFRDTMKSSIHHKSFRKTINDPAGKPCECLLM